MGAEVIGPIAQWLTILIAVVLGVFGLYKLIQRGSAAKDDLEEAKKAAKQEGKAQEAENAAPTSPAELDDALQRSLRDGGES